MARPHTPLLAVDLVIEMIDRPGRPILLIERRNPPVGWALPGGFVDVGERLEAAGRREAEEETGLTVDLETLLGCYSDPGRDPREHTVSVVFVGTASGSPGARDDARNLRLFDPERLPPLVFDHDLIMADYKRYRLCGERAPLRG